jgi:integrase
VPDNLYTRSGVWYARVQIRGRDERRSLRTTDRKVAASRLKALLDSANARRAGFAPTPAPATWADAVLAWADMAMQDLRPATRDRYRTSLRMLDPHFADRLAADLTSADFHAYALARRRGGASAATVRRDLAVASQVMQTAKRAGWRSDNPVVDELGAIKERREAIQPVPLRAVVRAIATAPAGLDEMIRFLLRTGCRQEEAGSLERAQVDLARRRVTFAKTKTRSPRVITIDAPTERVLRQAMARSTSDAVFTNRDGKRFKQLRSRFRDLIRRSLDLSPGRSGQRGGSVRPGSAVSLRAWRCHDLRHTHAIRALQRGVSIYELARRLGHTTVKTTEMYAAWLTHPPE